MTFTSCWFSTARTYNDNQQIVEYKFRVFQIHKNHITSKVSGDQYKEQKELSSLTSLLKLKVNKVM